MKAPISLIYSLLASLDPIIFRKYFNSSESEEKAETEQAISDLENRTPEGMRILNLIKEVEANIARLKKTVNRYKRTDQIVEKIKSAIRSIIQRILPNKA